MAGLRLNFRPTFESLKDEDYEEGIDDDAIAYEQGFMSSLPTEIGAEESFRIPQGQEAVITAPEEVVLYENEQYMGERIDILKTGDYLYKGNGVIQCID